MKISESFPAGPSNINPKSEAGYDLTKQGCKEILRSAVSHFRLAHQIKDEILHLGTTSLDTEDSQHFDSFLQSYQTLKSRTRLFLNRISTGEELSDDDVEFIQTLYDQVKADSNTFVQSAEKKYNITLTLDETMETTESQKAESGDLRVETHTAHFEKLRTSVSFSEQDVANLSPEKQQQYAEILDRIAMIEENMTDLDASLARGKSSDGLKRNIDKSLETLEKQISELLTPAGAVPVLAQGIPENDAPQAELSIVDQEEKDSLATLEEAKKLGRRQLEVAHGILEAASKAGVAESEEYGTAARLLSVLTHVTSQTLDEQSVPNKSERIRLERKMVRRIYLLVEDLNVPLTVLSRATNAASLAVPPQQEDVVDVAEVAQAELPVSPGDVPSEDAVVTPDAVAPTVSHEKGVFQLDTLSENPVEALRAEATVGDEIAPTSVIDRDGLRNNWRAAMLEHNDKQEAYRERVAAYYADLEAKKGLGKTWLKMKTAVGITPELPPEFEVERQEMLGATARYNALAREQVEKRERPLKTFYSKNPETLGRELDVMARYQRMLARTTILNTFNAQLSEQNKATENLSLRSNSFFAKNRKAISIVGAATLGGLTGGLATGGIAALRVVAGGAAAGAVTGWLAPKLDGYVENVQQMSDAEFVTSVAEIETLLGKGALSSEELNKLYKDLTAIYQRVDSAKQKRILGLIGAAMATGLILGAGVGQVMEVVGMGSDVLPDPNQGGGGKISDVTKSPSVPDTTFAQEKIAETPATEVSTPSAVDETPNSEAKAAPAVSKTEAADAASLAKQSDELIRQSELLDQKEAIKNTATYTVMRGDNMWDVLEGQTEAGRLSFLREVNPEMKQQLFKLVETRLANDAALRAEIGFGDTPHDIQTGAKLNIERLNALTLEIAGDKGLLYDPEVHGPLESEVPVATDVASPAAPEVPPTTPSVSEAVGTPNLEVAAAESTVGAETVQEKTPPAVSPVDAASVKKYISSIEGGTQAFEKDFRGVWVEKIQGPVPQSRGLLSGLFSIGPIKADAFEYFGNLPMEKFSELGKLPAPRLAEYLQAHNIESKDFNIWQTEAQKWQALPTIKIVPNMSFDEVAKAAYVAEKLSVSKNS